MADGPPDLDDSLLPSLTSSQPSAHPRNPTSPAASDDDSDDTPLNYAHLTHTHPQNSSALPRRGIKDFESHGTNAQRSVLENSRAAMHDALSVGRVHAGKGGLVGWFDVEGVDGMRRGGPRESRWGGDGERRVVIEKPTGQHVRTTGQADREGRLWLLPEEVVYLVERGSLEVRYRIADPPSPKKEEEGDEESDGGGSNRRQQEEIQTDGEEPKEGEDRGWDGVSLSLQACYAHFIGRDGLTLERYTVYAGLRRSGYIVLRAPEWYGHPPPNPSPNGSPIPEKGPGIWHWLYGTLLASPAPEPPPLGPLVGRGLYRNYSDIYRLLNLNPTNTTPLPSSTIQQNPFSTEPPLLPTFHVHTPNPQFRKRNPGPPDFYIAVLSTSPSSSPSSPASLFPTPAQLDTLFAAIPSPSPFSPSPVAPKDAAAKDAKSMYHRLKTGKRNAVLAVVDQGVTSFLRVAEAGFGEERVWEQRVGRGGKGGRGRGGRGRGG